MNIKKLTFTLAFALIACIASAQTSKSVNVSAAGGFSSALTAAGGNASKVTNLTVTGFIDARDIKFMRDNMPALVALDLEAVQINSYNGPGGTSAIRTIYPANEMPARSFYALVGKPLTSIKLPGSITSIGDSAFTYCDNLKGNLVIPTSVTDIGIMAFYNCSMFTGSLVIPGSVTKIGNGAFLACQGFTDTLILPNSLTEIGEKAFLLCSGITNIKVNADHSVFTDIDGILYNKAKTEILLCPSGKILSPLTIPNGVTSIANGAFCMCEKITDKLTLPNSLTSIGKDAFIGCSGLTGNLVIPGSVTKIGDGAFVGCEGFTGTLILPNSLTDLLGTIFSGSSGFTSVILPNIIKKYAWDMFYQCTGLTGDIVIPDSVEYIDNGAFRYCSAISACYIPASVNFLGSSRSDFMYYGAFGGCTGLRKVAINQSKPLTIASGAFEAVNKSLCELIVPMGSKAAYTIAPGWKEFKNITEAFFVTLNTQGGHAAAPVSTRLSNSLIAEPVNPLREGYSFAGWYKDTDCIIAWNFTSDTVTAPVTLFAKWTDNPANSFTVNFQVNGGSVVQNVVADSNALIAEPAAPLRTGYTFAGWYKEATCVNAWDFAVDKVTGLVLLFAKWNINKYTVTFNVNGGSAVADQVVNYCTKITTPKKPTKADCTFDGWYKDPEFTTIWNFATDVVTANMTLFAKWTATTSVEDNQVADFKFYPNPAKDKLYINFNSQNISGAIYDLHGKRVVDINPGINPVDISNLSKGIYFIKMINSGVIIVDKLIKE